LILLQKYFRKAAEQSLVWGLC